MIGIYKFTFPNGHYYIGQAIDLHRRELQHLRELKKQKHTNDRVQKCYNKYGEPTFEVLELCEIDELNQIETSYIAQSIRDEKCCNICVEGRSRKGTTQSDNAKLLIKNHQYASGKAKAVYMYTRDNMFLVGKFASIKDAESAIKCSPKDVQKSCKSNGYYNVKSYKFMYAMPVDNFLNHIKKIVKL